ncbi:MAG: NAD(P)/FAD-dependent oxidoreductase [Hellea sp.]|nr:NAD(P)/FAD-dependent oxidoreductase [Hellea sp.]
MQAVSTDKQYDAVIVGAGPAGSTLAMRLAKAGRRVLIAEQASFPRYHIGESLTGQCAETLEELGLGDYMGGGRYPVKHGVTVHGQKERSKFWVPVQRRDDNGDPLVRTTWQVRRKEFDAKLLETAIARGAHFIHGTAKKILGSPEKPDGVKVIDQTGAAHNFRAHIVVDASGQGAFLGRQQVLGPISDAGYEKQIAIFAHVTGLLLDPEPNHGNTHILYGKSFHWSWVIPQDDSVTSLGIVIPNAVYKASGLGKRDFFLKYLSELNPELSRRVADIEIVSPVRAISNYSYRYPQSAGPGFLAIGDAQGFLDPIFSFGVTIALKEAHIAASEIETYLDSGGEYGFENYLLKVKQAREIVQLIIDTFWQYPLAFLRLAHYSHKQDIAELFYGRFYEESTLELEAVKLMRELVGKKTTAKPIKNSARGPSFKK